MALKNETTAHTSHLRLTGRTLWNEEGDWYANAQSKRLPKSWVQRRGTVTQCDMCSRLKCVSSEMHMFRQSPQGDGVGRQDRRETQMFPNLGLIPGALMGTKICILQLKFFIESTTVFMYNLCNPPTLL